MYQRGGGRKSEEEGQREISHSGGVREETRRSSKKIGKRKIKWDSFFNFVLGGVTT